MNDSYQNNLSIVITIFCASVLFGCSAEPGSYFPLNRGYKWQYDVTEVTRDGPVKQKYFLENLGKREQGDKTVYLKRSVEDTLLYYSKSGPGVYFLGRADNAGIGRELKPDKQIVFPESVKPGRQWQQHTVTKLLRKTGPPQKTVFEITATVPVQVKVESINETVMVPAGRFEHCLKLNMSGSTFKDAGNYVGLTLVGVEQTSWYAKGVGLIKLERVETTQSSALDRGSLSLELVQYETPQGISLNGSILKQR